MQKPTAKSLILDLLSSQRVDDADTSMPVGALVAAARPFAIDGNALRVALARLLGAGLVVRDERGRYRLGAQAVFVAARVSEFRRVVDKLRVWRGDWVAVQSVGQPRGRAGREEQRALRLLGFQALTAGTSIRPNNLRGGVPEARAQLCRLGLGSGALVFALSELDTVSDERARGLWDVSALRAGYDSSLSALERSTRRLPRLSLDRALVETFTLGGQVLRQIALDPLLPEPLASPSALRGLVDAMKAYDRLGRSYWSTFLAEYGVAHERGPADVRIAQSPELGARLSAGSNRHAGA